MTEAQKKVIIDGHSGRTPIELALREAREMITQSEMQCKNPDGQDADCICDGTQCLYCALLHVIDSAFGRSKELWQREQIRSLK